MWEVMLDSLIDSLRLLPFLFITYLVMEWIEHKSKYDMSSMVQKRSMGGPVIGSLLGLFPQCGFSASAAGLYAGRMISMGTLVAVFISTSDEMLPILLSEQVEIGLIVRILLCKVAVAIAAGIGVDLTGKALKKEQPVIDIHGMCEKGHCHCENGIVRSALHHTVQVCAFILLISVGLNLMIYLIGEDALAGFILAKPIVGPILAGIVGLIPNCAASVLLTQLYLEGILSLGAMLAGLIAGSGIGLLVLFRVNADKKENMTILGILYTTGVVAGVLADLLISF